MEILEHFLLFGVIISWVTSISLHRSTKGLNARTTSQEAASSSEAQKLFVTGMTAAVLFMTMFVFGWMRDNLAVPDIFYPLYIVFVVMALITVWVPDRGQGSIPHNYAAFIMPYLLLAMTGLLYVEGFARNNNLQIAGVVFIVLMSIVGAHAQRTDLNNRHFLNTQRLYFLLFQLAFLARVYVV